MSRATIIETVGFVGVGAVVFGVYLLAGLAAAFIVGGASLVALALNAARLQGD